MRSVVTGAARGIGAAICRKLARTAGVENGTARIVASDIDADELETVAERLREEFGAEIVTCPGSVSELDFSARITEQAGEAFGGIDALFSNVGRPLRGAVIDTPVEDWDELFAVNVRSPWMLAVAARPLLAQSGGAIVFTTSMAGSHPAPFGPYSITKSAVVMLMKQLSVELGPSGIRVNSVAPSMVYTSGTSAAYSKPGVQERKNAAVPLRRISQPEEIAEAACFLAGPGASYITGVDLQVDGGFGNMIMYLTQGSGDWE